MSSDSPVAVIYDGLGNAVSVVANSLAIASKDSLGQAQYNFPAGLVRTSDEPRSLFIDPFDASLDTTNRWASPTSSGGGVAATVSSGNLTLGSGTTASGKSYLQSAPTFAPTIPAWIGVSFYVKFEFPFTTNATRFWGLGTSPGTPTAAVSITDGMGFEIFTDGKMYASVYSAGVRTAVQDLSPSGNSQQPTDTNYHRYSIYTRLDKIYWYIDALDVPSATSNFQNPSVQTLPLKLSAIANTTGPSSSCVINCTGIATWDTGKNNTQLSDGTFPWRKGAIDSIGNLQTKSISSNTNQTTVAGSASSVTLLAANTARLGATIFNDSTSMLYIKLGATASTTSFTVQLLTNAYYEIPYGYTGRIDGIWGSATGNSRITEIS